MTNYTTPSLTASVKSLVFILSILGTSTFAYNQQIQLNLSSGETQTLELSQVNGMKITGDGTLQLVCGSQGIQITESLVLGSQVKLVCDETIHLVGSGILQASRLHSNISIQGDWELISDLTLKPEKEAHFHNTEINLGSSSVISDHLIFSGVNLIHANGGVIVANKSFLSNEQLEVESAQAEVIFIPELAEFNGATNLPVHFFSTAVNTCGDPEFEITVEVTSDYNGEDISCNGADDAEVQCVVTGGVGPFVYEWFGVPGGNTAGETYSGLGAGTYTVLVTDQGQDVFCVENVEIAEPPALAIFTLNLTMPSCVALCNGSTNPIMLGGTGLYSFEYSNGGTDQENINLCAGVNTLLISDVNNCQLDTTFIIEEDFIDINLIYPDSLCFGDNSGIASVSPTGGGGGPYDILWSNSEVTNSISNLSEGIYSVEILYADDCSIDSMFTVFGLEELIVTIDELENPVCVDDTNGIISVSISGGAPEYTLSWVKDGLPFSIEEDLSDLGVGFYELSVTDDFGCTGSLSLNLELQGEIIVESTLVEIDCFENCNASIIATIIEPQEPITFTWSDENGIISNANFIENICSGTYDLLTTNGPGCEYSETFIIDEPEEIEIIEDITDVSCNGLSEGSILLMVSGGSAPYSTSPPSTEVSPGEFLLDNLIAGSYSVDVIDDAGCVISVPFDVTEPEPLEVAFSFEDPICFGLPSGSITLVVSGGSTPYSIEWMELGVFDELSQSDLPPGDYNILITDTNGCTESLTVTLEGPLEITVEETINPILCNGDSTGSIELEVSNPIGDLNVLWIGDVTNPTDLNQFDLQAGEYEVSVIDENGCEYNGAYEILESLELEVTENIINPLCFGEQGEISIEITGGQEPYDVSWAEIEAPNQQTIMDLTTGIYTVTVLDQNLCEVTASYEIIPLDEIVFTVEVTQPDCILPSGTLEIVNITGGNTPSGGLNEYTIDWTGISAQGQTLASNLNPGEYAIIISDDNDCEVTEFFIIDEPDLIGVTETVLPIFCFGGNEGSIELEVFGATEPLDVVWTGDVGNNSDLNQFNLSAGSYSLDIVDGAGCNFSAIYEVTEAEEIEITELIIQPGCEGTLGSIEITGLTGGTSLYSFIWLEVEAPDQNLIENLESGDYTIQVTDTANCTIEEIYTITEPSVLEVSIEVTAVLCNEANTGSLSVNIDSDNPIEDISWFDDGVLLTDGLITTIENLSSGTYSVEITDDQECSVSQTILISEPQTPLINADVSGVNCLGDSNGSILVTVTSGAEPYTLTWSGPLEIANNQYNPTTLIAGDYVASVTDSEGCIVFQEFSVLSPDSLSINETITNVSCFGNGDGVIVLELIGGTEPFTIDWIDSDDDLDTLTDLFPGEYSVMITDDNGCQLIETYEVESANQLVEGIEITNICFGEPGTGAIEIMVAGEASSYSISWTGNGLVSDEPSLTDLNEGCYVLEVLDNNNCLYTEEVCIASLDEIILNTSATGNVCFTDEQGQIELEVSGGAPGYSIEWLNSDAEFVSDQVMVTELAAGVYTVNINDNNGCTASANASITSNPELFAEISETPIVCFGDENGALDVTYSGGVGALTLTWTGPNGFVSEEDQNSNLDNGDYCYEVVDFVGCVISDCYALNDPDPLNLGQTVNNINCFGANEGEVLLEVSGGYAPYTTFWTLNGDPFSTDEDISDLAVGEYTLALSDMMGCLITDTLTVTELTQLTVNFDNIVGASCASSLDGAFEITVSGGMLDYSYSWVLNGTEESTEEDPSELNEGDYQLTVTDGNDCSTEIASVIIPVIGTVEIIVPDNISWCFTEDLQLIEAISSEAQSIEWTSPPSLDILSTTSSVFFQEEPGVYELVITGTDGPCAVSSTIEITIYEAPAADAGEDQEAELLDEVILGGNPTTEDFNTVVWTPSELLNESSLFNPSYLLVNSIQTFVLTVTSPEGCVSEDSTQVILNPEIDIHSGFTPNSDNINDVWVIGNLQNYPSIEVWVYNRWGEELFYSQGYNQPWDGTYNGNSLPIGTYYYVIDFNKPGFQLSADGPVTILR